jgi:hypothetical protein
MARRPVTWSAALVRELTHRGSRQPMSALDPSAMAGSTAEAWQAASAAA